MTKQELAQYEIASMPWCGYLENKLLREWAAKYLAWKVRRKYMRYERHCKVGEILASQASEAEKFAAIYELDHKK